MAEVDYANSEHGTYESETGAYSAVGTGNPTQIASGSLTADDTYMLIGGARIGGNNTTNVTHAAVHAGGTIIADTEIGQEAKSASTTVLDNYGFVDQYVVPSTPVALEWYLEDTGGNGTAGGNSWWLIAINVSDLDSDHYAYAEDGTAADHTASMADRASVTLSNTTSGDNIAVFASAQIDVNDTSNSYEIDLLEASTSMLGSVVKREGEDTSERRQHLIIQRFVATGSSHTFKIQTRDDYTGTQHAYVRSGIWALNLTELFETHAVAEDATHTVSSTGAFEQALTMNYTPSTTGNVFVFGCTNHVGLAAFREAWIRVQKDNGANSVFASMDDGESHVADGVDNLTISLGAVISGTASTAMTLDFDVRDDSTTFDPFEDTTLIAFSAEKKAAAANTRRYSLFLTGVG